VSAGVVEDFLKRAVAPPILTFAVAALGGGHWGNPPAAGDIRFVHGLCYDFNPFARVVGG
jgi:hypothetical protein